MAEIRNIQEFGNQLVVLFDDGSKRLAYPTTGGLWLLQGKPDDPGPDPNPGGPRFIWPFDLRYVNPGVGEFGQRWGRLHAGIDFGQGPPNQVGTPIPCAAAGVVYRAGDGGGYGNRVVVDHGGGLMTHYAHMHPGTMAVRQGDTVTQRQTLGGTGNTGASLGVHLHFETHEGGFRGDSSARNPRLFFEKYNV